MKLSEMITFVRTISGDTDASQYHTDDEIILFLNESALVVSSKTLSLQSYSDAATVDTDERYPLPEDFLALKDVQIIEGENRYQLLRLTYDEYEQSYGQGHESGRPRHFKMELGATGTVAGSAPGDIWLQPVPDAVARTLRIAYYQRTSNLDSTKLDDSYELKSPFHRSVCYHAAMELAFKLSADVKAAQFKALFDQSIADAMELIGRSDRSEPHQFQKAYNSGKSQWRRRR